MEGDPSHLTALLSCMPTACSQVKRPQLTTLLGIGFMIGLVKASFGDELVDHGLFVAEALLGTSPTACCLQNTSHKTKACLGVYLSSH